MDQEWVYGVVELEGGAELLVLPRPEAEQQVRWVKVLSSGTWGELRQVATADEYIELLEHAGYEVDADLSSEGPNPDSEELTEASDEEETSKPPSDEQPFLPSQAISSWWDGFFPPDLHYLMYQLLPRDVAKAHGEIYVTMDGAHGVTFSPEAMPGLVTAMRQHGFVLEEDRGLLSAAAEPI